MWTVHNLFPHERGNVLLEYVGRVMLAWYSDIVFVHFHAARKYLFCFGRVRNVYTIPHGNFQTIFKSTYTKGEARRKLRIPGDVFVYLIFGPIRHYKGIDDAIRAFEHMDTSDAGLVIAGSPVDRNLSAWILERAKSNPTIMPFLEFIEKEDVQLYVNSADVILLPYKNVFTSGNLFLALTFNKPVVAPDRGIISEIVDDKCGVKYVPHKNNLTLLEAMKKVRNINLSEVTETVREKTLGLTWEKAAKVSHEAFVKHLGDLVAR
ncbi:MAG: glycosyltransferase [Planctomycetota bacterium]